MPSRCTWLPGLSPWSIGPTAITDILQATWEASGLLWHSAEQLSANSSIVRRSHTTWLKNYYDTVIILPPATIAVRIFFIIIIFLTGKNTFFKWSYLNVCLFIFHLLNLKTGKNRAINFNPRWLNSKQKA